MREHRGWRIHWTRTTFRGKVHKKNILMLYEEKRNAINLFWRMFQTEWSNVKSVQIVRIERVWEERTEPEEEETSCEKSS